MSSETEIDGRRATQLAQQYFVEQYGPYGVLVFEIESAEYNQSDKSWTVTCSFFRTFMTAQKSYYSVVIYSDGRIGPVKRIEQQSR